MLTDLQQKQIPFATAVAPMVQIFDFKWMFRLMAEATSSRRASVSSMNRIAAVYGRVESAKTGRRAFSFSTVNTRSRCRVGSGS